MLSLYDEDGIDGPFEKAMRQAEKEDRRIEKDARAFRDGVGAIEALIEAPVDLQVQHYEMPRARRAACGATGGQTVRERLGVTCEKCKRRMARRGSK